MCSRECFTFLVVMLCSVYYDWCPLGSKFHPLSGDQPFSVFTIRVIFHCIDAGLLRYVTIAKWEKRMMRRGVHIIPSIVCFKPCRQRWINQVHWSIGWSHPWKCGMKLVGYLYHHFPLICMHQHGCGQLDIRLTPIRLRCHLHYSVIHRTIVVPVDLDNFKSVDFSSLYRLRWLSTSGIKIRVQELLLGVLRLSFKRNFQPEFNENMTSRMAFCSWN